MKCSELLRQLLKDGWVVVSSKGSHLKMMHQVKKGIIIFPDHGSKEMGKGMANKIKKDAGLK
jgi:predicted RNA binding protein YcfA (HicA-like mRNA interferase family)